MTRSPPLSAEDWPTDPERRYAKRQARFATECGLDVESRTIEADAVGRIHYLAAGATDGEPVVLLHGTTEPAAIWLPMMSALADRYPAVRSNKSM